MASSYIRSLRRFWIAVSLVWLGGAIPAVWFTHANTQNDAVRARFVSCQAQPDRKWQQCWDERLNARLEVTGEALAQMGLVATAPLLVFWLTGWGVLVTARRLWRWFGLAGKSRGLSSGARQPSTLRMLA